MFCSMIPVFARDKRQAFARRSCSNKEIERDDDSKSRRGAQYLESQIGIAAHPSRRPLRGLLRMRSNLLKHNNLMLRSERRERLEAWAASDSPISHSQYWLPEIEPSGVLR